MTKDEEVRCWVKWYKPDLKYGFAYDDDELNYFIHKSEFVDEIEFVSQGDTILGIPRKNEKGLYLSNIKIEV
jgi:hypothetical protein